jgi:hypothetical protein
MKAWYISGVLAAATLLPACATEPLAVRSTQGQTLTLSVGQELDLTVGTVGAGEYATPPSISSTALRFLDAKVVPPYLPSGPTQLFRFQADARGRALVVITHSGDNPTIQDTVVIR